MACWDNVGKELGKPVSQLLGGRVRDTLRSYTYIYPELPEDSPTISNYPEGDEKSIYTDADMVAERASTYVRKGFNALKFDPLGHRREALLARLV